MTVGLGSYLAVRANANLDIQLCILILVPLHCEELVEQVIQAAMDGLSVHEEAGIATLHGPADVANHVLLGLRGLVILEGTHLEDLGALLVQDGAASMIGAEQQAVCRIITCRAVKRVYH